MNNFFDELEEPVELTPNKGRKRKTDKENHVRTKKQKKLYSGDDKQSKLNCCHDGTKHCLASKLTEDDIKYNFKLFHQTASKQTQDDFILRMTDTAEIKRNRVRDTERKLKRNYMVNYFVFQEDRPDDLMKDSNTNNSNNDSESVTKDVDVSTNTVTTIKVPVCKESFLSIFAVSKGRCDRVIQFYKKNNVPRPEHRGGWRKDERYNQLKMDIRSHILGFSCRASHYGRRGAPGRKYLSSNLSVAQMHRLFKEQNHEQVTYALYHSIFSYDFNLGFGHPATDVCSTCVKHRLHIKDPQLNDEDKKKETMLYMLHRRRSRVFYDLLNNVDSDSVTISFDMMENLVLPKTPVNLSYYSRQLYMYLFCVVVHHGKKSAQSKEDVFFYVWGEHENKKDSNMTASALTHVLLCQLHSSIIKSTSLKLFSDSCFGQNKNFNVLSMLCAMNKRYFPDVNINYTFPVRGHSFLPADRVFGRLEKDFRKLETMLLPADYYKVLEQHGSLFIYGKDWKSYNFKKETATFVRNPRPFKISEAKVINISVKGIEVKTTYNAACDSHTILKQGKSWMQFNPSALDFTSTVKEEKKKDVLKLLNDIAAPNSVMDFYNSALTFKSPTIAVHDDSDSE